ncbi:MAG: hypothetical protein ABFR75_00320 [Acidobacteriota bacterium]
MAQPIISFADDEEVLRMSRNDEYFSWENENIFRGSKRDIGDSHLK